MKRITLCLLFMTLCSSFSLLAEDPSKKRKDYGDIKSGFVIGNISCQMGNNLFQVAATLAYGWEHQIEAYFPGLAGNIPHLQHVFSRCNTNCPEGAFTTWAEPSHKYHPIPFKNNVMLDGYFQSEKYFQNYRQKIIEHLEPRKEDLNYIMDKYGHLLTQPKTVGVHLRWYFEDGAGSVFIQYGKDYLKKAMAQFPKDSLFIICSNNPAFARKNMPEHITNVIFIENEADYIDLYLLSLCKHNIITNSTFGWWGAWLNNNPRKIVIAPYTWLHPVNGPITKDVVPKSWEKIKAKWGPVSKPETYQ
ncbi:MAG: alpha-1,2-fucosyltransferase [Parachlamydiaceae bacterium]|nr:alpha-1,2-fucosyltransferase [Parachlamydiaceae bacterium]